MIWEWIALDDAAIEVSVVVPTYGQAAGLRRLLESIEALEDAPPFEVVVVNDGSPDDTDSVVREWASTPRSFPTRYLSLARNSGPAAARNQGTREARGRIVAYTDSDCRVDPAWLGRLVSRLDPGAGVVGVGGRVRAENPETFFSKYYTVNPALEPAESLLYLVTANCCFLRECVLEAGGFDEDLVKPGGEDIAISVKMFQKGWRFAFEPEAIVFHDYREGLRAFITTWRNYAYGCGYVTGKYFGWEPDEGADAAWNKHTVRPPWLSPRATRVVLEEEHAWCREHRVSWPLEAAFLLLRLVQMLVQFWYFRKGEKAAAEGARPPLGADRGDRA